MRHFTICDSLYYAPQVIYPFSAKSAWSRFIGTCLSHLILLLPTSSSCLAQRGVPLHNIVYTCARWPAPPVWLSLYFGHYKVNRSKCDGRPCCDLSQVKPGLPTLLWILCWVQQLVRARSWRVSNQLCSPVAQTVTLASFSTNGKGRLILMLRMVDCVWWCLVLCLQVQNNCTL